MLYEVITALLGVSLFEVVRRASIAAKKAQEEEQARHVLQNAQREAENIVKEAKLEAKDLVFQSKAEVEKEQKSKLAELSTTEKRLVHRITSYNVCYTKLLRPVVRRQ